ncbi:MAG: hypothetical protein HYR59_04715 [Acidobacteria bacterium]|nr:hypothetical protein [Acidobacteriota bacterium]
MKRSTVASLAILKVNYERRGKDYIDNFVPFVVEAIRTSADDIVSLPALQETLRNQFGLSLPLNPLRHILQRAAREGFLRRDGGVFYREPDACSKSTFAEIQQEVGAIQSSVTVALRDFARDQHSVEWTEEHTEQALLSFVADTGLDVLFASAERSVLSTPSLEKGTSFIVASFVAECRLKLPVLFEDIETIIKGALLANALYFSDAGKIAQRFKNTRVYLDTSILIYYLGYAGSDRRAPCAELVSLLKDYGADLRCFRQTLEEASGILDSCAARIRKGQLRDAYGPSIEYFVTQGLTSTDIDLLAARLPHKLASLGIEVEEKPTYKHKHEFVIDERGFQAKLKNEVGYHSDKALQHDVDCVSAIARLRAGRDSYYVENCGACSAPL